MTLLACVAVGVLSFVLCREWTMYRLRRAAELEGLRQRIQAAQDRAICRALEQTTRVDGGERLMPTITLHADRSGLVLVCPDHGVIHIWDLRERVPVADVACAEHDHLLTHILEESA